MFTGTNIIDFFESFEDENSCLKYLSDIKWKDRFVCRKCKHTGWCKTIKPFVRKCNRCKYKESPTANTLFHKVKFPLRKAFFIVFMMSTSKKSWSSEEYARKLSLHKRTCWLFQHKVRSAMKNDGSVKIKTNAIADEFSVGGPEENKPGRSKGKKQTTLMIIESNEFGILKCYAEKIANSGTKELKPVIEKYVHQEANIKTDKWRGYSPLKKQYPNLIQVKSDKGKNFPLIHRQIMSFKGWLRGIHHHCKHLQNYLDEYCFRFNHSSLIDKLFDVVVNTMINQKPLTLNQIQINWGS